MAFNENGEYWMHARYHLVSSDHGVLKLKLFMGLNLSYSHMKIDVKILMHWVWVFGENAITFD